MAREQQSSRKAVEASTAVVTLRPALTSVTRPTAPHGAQAAVPEQHKADELTLTSSKLLVPGTVLISGYFLPPAIIYPQFNITFLG